MNDWTNEGEILETLRRGLQSGDPVPSTVSEFARALFDWRSIDADLAELSFDSVDEATPAGIRSSATIRMLSFEAGERIIDIEYKPVTGSLMGQVTPGTDFSVELHIGGARFAVRSDESGHFEFEDVERGPASLIFRFGDEEVVKTGWVVL